MRRVGRLPNVIKLRQNEISNVIKLSKTPLPFRFKKKRREGCFWKGINSMNKKMIKALKNKYIYVDIDGTLAEYRFNNHVSAKDGTANGQTMKEIENHIFLHSRPLKAVIKTLKKARTKNKFICGAIISPIEVMDKFEWLKTYCSGINFKDYYWFVPDEYWNRFSIFFMEEAGVSNPLKENVVWTKYGYFFKGSKTRIWGWVSVNSHHCIEDAVFIDDVLSYLKYAEKLGVTAYHVSSFID